MLSYNKRCLQATTVTQHPACSPQRFDCGAVLFSFGLCLLSLGFLFALSVFPYLLLIPSLPLHYAPSSPSPRLPIHPLFQFPTIVIARRFRSVSGSFNHIRCLPRHLRGRHNSQPRPLVPSRTDCFLRSPITDCPKHQCLSLRMAASDLIVSQESGPHHRCLAPRRQCHRPCPQSHSALSSTLNHLLLPTLLAWAPHGTAQP